MCTELRLVLGHALPRVVDGRAAKGCRLGARVGHHADHRHLARVPGPIARGQVDPRGVGLARGGSERLVVLPESPRRYRSLKNKLTVER